MKELVKKNLAEFKRQREYWIKQNEDSIKSCEIRIAAARMENIQYRMEINEVDVLLEIGDTLFKEKGEVK